MREIELKLLLNPAQEKALRTSAVVRAMTQGRPRTQTLWNIYYDTPDGALRAQRIALRLRKAGRGWIQTVKRAGRAIALGLSTPEEIEFPVRGQNLALDRIPDDDLRETLLGHAQSGLIPVVETRFRRTTRVLRTDSGTEVEMCIDVGELVAGDQTAPLAELEFELLDGTAADLYTLAGEVMTYPSVRFAQRPKSERALALLEEPVPFAPRKAQRLALSPDQTVEQAALAIFGEGLAHYMPNLADLLETDTIAAPHQTRVALRRLRSALNAFRPAFGAEILTPWNTQARLIAAEAGRLRDMDVLLAELSAEYAIPEDEGTRRLTAAYQARRDTVRTEVRNALAHPDITRFGIAFAGFLAGDGWLAPADHDQSGRLAQPLAPYAARILQKRWKAVARYGARMADLHIEERHEMRKELKKFRYLLDAFRGLYPDAQSALWIRRVKDLQTAFGALNDQAMLELILSASDAPLATDPLAQRAAGRMIGYQAAEADRLWPKALTGWAALKSIPRPWKPDLC